MSRVFKFGENEAKIRILRRVESGEENGADKKAMDYIAKNRRLVVNSCSLGSFF